MPVSSTYVLLRVLSSFQRCNPCIFRMCVVTCASLQSGALANSVFKDLLISLSWDCLSHDAICSCCFLVIRASFEDDQLRSFVNLVVLYPSMSLFAIMEHPSLSQSSSTFASW